jgi:hypothetical protein
MKVKTNVKAGQVVINVEESNNVGVGATIGQATQVIVV